MPAPTRDRGHRLAAYRQCSADRRGATILTSPVVAAVLGGVGGDSPGTAPGDHDVWELSGAAHSVRWVVVHNLVDGRKKGVYHVEVLEREKGAPRWQFRRLAAHMALTRAALRASVVRPLKSGRVSPEQFEAAFAEWRRRSAAGTAPVCDRTIVACLERE